MDGVLVDSEAAWQRYQLPYFERVFGRDIAAHIGTAPGIGIDGVYEKAVAMGVHIDLDSFRNGFEEVAMQVYDVSPLTPGLDELARTLLQLRYRFGLVTNSPSTWIARVLPRLSFQKEFAAVVPLKDRQELKRKPAPDGFLEAMRLLQADSQHSIVLEDSNPGIAAGKASGAYVIGFRGNLLNGYRQEGADTYADTMAQVAVLAEAFGARI